MEIIKSGKLDIDKEAEFSCRHCSAVISAKRGEGLYTSDQRDGDYIRFQCPYCNKLIHVSLGLFH